jgi:voltage-gated potassium channel Kch
VKHRGAAITVVTAAGLDLLGGLAFAQVEHIPADTGLYWSVTTATTVGYGDVSPKTTLGHLIAVFVMLTVIPLFAATFSLFTSGLTAGHIHDAEARIKAHVEERLKHHLGD